MMFSKFRLLLRLLRVGCSVFVGLSNVVGPAESIGGLASSAWHIDQMGLPPRLDVLGMCTGQCAVVAAVVVVGYAQKKAHRPIHIGRSDKNKIEYYSLLSSTSNVGVDGSESPALLFVSCTLRYCDCEGRG